MEPVVGSLNYLCELPRWELGAAFLVIVAISSGLGFGTAKLLDFSTIKFPAFMQACKDFIHQHPIFRKFIKSAGLTLLFPLAFLFKTFFEGILKQPADHLVAIAICLVLLFSTYLAVEFFGLVIFRPKSSLATILKDMDRALLFQLYQHNVRITVYVEDESGKNLTVQERVNGSFKHSDHWPIDHNDNAKCLGFAGQTWYSTYTYETSNLPTKEEVASYDETKMQEYARNCHLTVGSVRFRIKRKKSFPGSIKSVSIPLKMKRRGAVLVLDSAQQGIKFPADTELKHHIDLIALLVDE